MVDDIDKYRVNKMICLLNQIVEHDYGSDRKAVNAIFSMKSNSPSLSAIYRARKGKTRSEYLINCYISDLLSAGTIPMNIPSYLNRECIQFITRSVLKNRKFVDTLNEKLKGIVLSEMVIRPSSENFQDNWYIDMIDIYDIDILSQNVFLYSKDKFSLEINIGKNDIDCDLSCILTDGSSEERSDTVNINATIQIIIPLEFENEEPLIDNTLNSIEITDFDVR